MKALLRALRELLYPSRAVCLGCGDPVGADEWVLCATCRSMLTPLHQMRGERCLRCGRPGHWDRGCPTCREWPKDAIVLARFVYAYRRPVERMIRQMKYASVYSLCDWMGGQIADLATAEALPQCDVVVPVPMHAKRLRLRGFNHAERIARAVASQLALPLSGALFRTRNTRQQARLQPRLRRRNLVDAFEADAEAIFGKRVLLVDDVLTTGATALHCALALKNAGARHVVVLALAGPQRRR